MDGPPGSPSLDNATFSFLMEKLKQSSTLIFDTYLKCHINPPDGTRQQLSTEEITEDVLPDRILFRDQLVMIGTCARRNPEHSVPVLCELLEQRITMLRSYLCQLHANPQSAKSCDDLFEDLHWALLLAGNILTTDSDGEATPIPTEIQQYSLKCSSDVDISATLTLLARPQAMPAEMGVPSAMVEKSKIDPVIRLLAAVLRLAHTEGEVIAANMGSVLSPEVSITMIWFLKRYTVSYLLPLETLQGEMSVALTSAFGSNSEGAAWALNNLLTIIERTLRLRSGEPSLVAETIRLLIATVNSEERGRLLVKSEKLLSVVQLQQSGQLASLSSNASRGLMQGLVLMIGCAKVEQSVKEEVWAHVVDPVIQSFTTLLAKEDFSKNYLMDNYRTQVLHHLDNLVGAIRGSLMASAGPLFTRITPCLRAIVKLLDLYHNYSDIVVCLLEVYVECGRRILCYLSASDSKELYECAVEIVKVYAKHNIGRRSAVSQDDQDQWKDLQLLMELLTSLLSKVRMLW